MDITDILNLLPKLTPANFSYILIGFGHKFTTTFLKHLFFSKKNLHHITLVSTSKIGYCYNVIIL